MNYVYIYIYIWVIYVSLSWIYPRSWSSLESQSRMYIEQVGLPCSCRLYAIKSWANFALPVKFNGRAREYLGIDLKPLDILPVLAVQVEPMRSTCFVILAKLHSACNDEVCLRRSHAICTVVTSPSYFVTGVLLNGLPWYTTWIMSFWRLFWSIRKNREGLLFGGFFLRLTCRSCDKHQQQAVQ